MADYIVTKLRERRDYGIMLACDRPRPAPDRLCHDAADEIERLRAALRGIASHPDTYLYNYEMALEAGDERIKKLDTMLCQRFARSAPIEEALLQIGMGKRGLPTREECKEWGITLGVPDDVRAVLTATARAETAEARNAVLVGALQECEPFVAHFKGGWCTLTHAQISTDELLETIRAALAKDTQTS
jgi:hypothetical protein